jgi:hypothetical protein
VQQLENACSGTQQFPAMKPSEKNMNATVTTIELTLLAILLVLALAVFIKSRLEKNRAEYNADDTVACAVNFNFDTTSAAPVVRPTFGKANADTAKPLPFTLGASDSTLFDDMCLHNAGVANGSFID